MIYFFLYDYSLIIIFKLIYNIITNVKKISDWSILHLAIRNNYCKKFIKVLLGLSTIL